MYVQVGGLKGPAWIGYVEFSRTGRTAYFNGRCFSKGRGWAHDINTGEIGWITGVKKRGSNRHEFGGGKILVARDALAEFLALKGWAKLESGYGLFDPQPAPKDVEVMTDKLESGQPNLPIRRVVPRAGAENR